ncbi:MAG: hypothetical protein JW755_00255 [Candidatus Aminicenantes bacterium]|nr:hypothetical protein [Candidatus Aminicenantes bacterium]
MVASGQKKIVIPCSHCGDTLRLSPFEIDEDREIFCPRCRKTFIPSKALVERVLEIKKAIIKEIEEGS